MCDILARQGPAQRSIARIDKELHEGPQLRSRFDGDTLGNLL